ncbi:MAG TPA: HAMP domain-containing sensor histidine kinase [Phycisphaerales bacterium]|nr:HAMP domain-containing sensor histidine kinase [Phycisphaerales bacterium]HMP35824.1 HAMP domain-containing sensor histidine kinase [Phycisphaerales bacterium]
MPAGAEWYWFCAGAVAAAFLVALALLPAARSFQQRVEARARDAERRARDAERLAELGSMTGGLAHEIKNPLSTLGLNAQLMAEELIESDLEPERRDRLVRRTAAIRREADRLRDILTDFLRYAGRFQLDRQPCALFEVVDELADFLAPQCQQSGVLLRVETPPTEIIASVDRDLLKQALLNLMLNAIQAMTGPPRGGGPAGGAEARATASLGSLPRRGELILRVEGDDREARIHVIDTGPGIEPDRIDEVFRPYVSTKPGGTGLGLPTARRIVEEHGGRLVAHSRPGDGSDFVIALPRAQ